MPKPKPYKPLKKEPLPTREVDVNQMVAVKIDAKTTVYVKPGRDIEEVKLKYKK